MSYLVSQIFWCLLLAFLIGFVLGWLLRAIACSRAMAQLRAQRAAVPAAAPASPPAGAEAPAAATLVSAPAALPEPVLLPGYPVEDIEGIGAGFGKRLRAEGIDTTDQLLTHYLTEDGSRRMCSACDIDADTLHSWATMADLMRIPGVGGQWAELLWRSGIRRVQDLTGLDPEALLAKMESVNQDEHRVHELPGRERAAHWIAVAPAMPEVLPPA